MHIIHAASMHLGGEIASKYMHDLQWKLLSVDFRVSINTL